jgi:type III pantothenate kinase
MYSLSIDFGNTSIKAGLFDNNVLIDNFRSISQVDILKIANENQDYQIILCSVGISPLHFINLIENKSRLLILDVNTKLPITNNYETPETLGLDRLAAAIGINSLFPNENYLVIDTGTCITYDIIDKNAIYQGGNISLGLTMRFKALAQFTSKLPMLKPEDYPTMIGKNTKNAILTGVIEGIIGEIHWFINKYRSIYPDLKIAICGGDAIFFETKIKEHIFAAPELVLIGLNRILQYNAI